MTFDEWWVTLETREQNSTNYALTKEAWQAALAEERERCAKLCEEIGVVLGGTASPTTNEMAAAIRALGE